jgi:5-methylcytosine-specific restriction enzyme A
MDTGRTPSASEARFHQAMIDIYSLAGRATGYWANYFLRSVRKDGGLNTARKLLWKSGTSAGFERLQAEHRLDLSMEALMLKPEFRGLFSEVELAMASERLLAHGYRPGDC